MAILWDRRTGREEKTRGHIVELKVGRCPRDERPYCRSVGLEGIDG